MAEKKEKQYVSDNTRLMAELDCYIILKKQVQFTLHFFYYIPRRLRASFFVYSNKNV